MCFEGTDRSNACGVCHDRSDVNMLQTR